MKRRIRLTESDIRNIVKRSVKRILKEDVGTPDMEGRWFELCWRLDEKQMQNAMRLRTDGRRQRGCYGSDASESTVSG